MTEPKPTTMTDGQQEDERWVGHHVESGLTINEDCKIVPSHCEKFIKLDMSSSNYLEAYLRMTPRAAMILVEALSDEIVKFCKTRIAQQETETEPV
jgi:hypothetical protein